MPRAKWGSGDDALTASDIDGAETSSFTPYGGPMPKSGLYRFITKSMKQGVSGTGNPKLRTILELDGSWKPEHKKYDGCPLFDNMPVMKKTAFRAKAFCEAYGITAREFHNGIVIDEDGNVLKLASAGDPVGIEVFVNVKYVPENNGYAEKIEFNGTGYLPVDEAPNDEADDATADETDDSDEPPF